MKLPSVDIQQFLMNQVQVNLMMLELLQRRDGMADLEKRVAEVYELKEMNDNLQMLNKQAEEALAKAQEEIIRLKEDLSKEGSE